MMIPRLEAKALGSGRTILACAPRPWARYSASLCLGFLACGRGAVGVLQVPGSWAARAPPTHRPEVPPLAAPAASTGRLTCGMAQPTSNSKLHSAQVADFGDEHAAGAVRCPRFRVESFNNNNVQAAQHEGRQGKQTITPKRAAGRESAVATVDKRVPEQMQPKTSPEAKVTAPRSCPSGAS